MSFKFHFCVPPVLLELATLTLTWSMAVVISVVSATDVSFSGTKVYVPSSFLMMYQYCWFGAGTAVPLRLFRNPYTRLFAYEIEYFPFPA